MKQNLRLGDNYALLATNYTKHKRKRTGCSPLDVRSSSAVSPLRLDTRCATAPYLTRTRSAISSVLLRSFSACSPLLLRCFSAAPPLEKRRRNGKHTDNKEKNGSTDIPQVRSRYSAGNDLQRKINRAEAGNPNGQSPWGEAGLALPQIPPSLTLPSGSIRVCPAYTSVKVLTSGTLAKDRRLYSGIEAYKEGHGMGWGRLRKNLLCVQTLAQALALPGRGRANGVLLCLLFLFTQPGVHAQSMPRVSREDVNDSVEIKRIPRFMPEADLERFRLVKYHVQVDSAFRGIRIGDTIPDVLWDFPLWVVNDPEGKDTIRLREHQDTDLLVLDFWASWCSPCVESMHKWEGYTGQLGKRVKLIGVHIDYDYKALPFSRRRNWRVMSVIGADARMLNRYFFDRSTVSRLIWIKNGKLAAITGGSGYDLDTVRRFADGESVAIPIDTNWTYSSNAQSTANR